MMNREDFDYDYYDMKFGIDLRPTSEDGDDAGEKEPNDREAKDKPADMKNADAEKLKIYDWFQCIVSAVLCSILIFTYIGRINGIEGPSMMQTLQNGDKVILSNLFYHPEKGDIVFIKTDIFGEKPIVKRIIATEGQTVDIDFTQGTVSVDGQVLIEDYTNTKTNLEEGFDGPVVVPDGCVFVMGDNRNDSVDSRDNRIGYVNMQNILGKVYFVIIPGKGYGETRDWSRFGSVYS
jgi:signal peptidase I